MSQRCAALSIRLMSIGLVVGGCHQPASDLVDRQLIGEVMMHSELSANLRALAMPGGRLTGTPGAEQAQQFVADKLRAYGLRNVHLEPFKMQCWTVTRTQVTVLDDSPRVLEGAVALSKTISTPPEGVTAELIDLGEAKEADIAARGAELAGKFVLVREGRGTRIGRLRRAVEHGAAGLVVMSQPERAPVIGNGHTEPRPEPAVVIRHDQEVLDRLARGETVQVNIQLDTENWDCQPSNVVGEIPGRGPLAREIVILSAHLDSWHLGEGALDNGTGATAILEAARVLANAGWQPRRTVRFVWFMAEELGLDGSEAYAQAHADELDHVVAVVNVDMPGAPRVFGVFGHPEIEPFLQALRHDLAGYELEPKIAAWSWEGSDHTPFTQRGVCALSLGGDLGPGVKNYHTPGDVYDVVDRRGTIQSAAVLAVVVRRLADVPERPTTRRAPASEPSE